MNYGGVCRTAPATPGLLNMLSIAWGSSVLVLTTDPLSPAPAPPGLDLLVFLNVKNCTHDMTCPVMCFHVLLYAVTCLYGPPQFCYMPSPVYTVLHNSALLDSQVVGVTHPIREIGRVICYRPEV